jgi:hypothetical protein
VGSGKVEIEHPTGPDVWVVVIPLSIIVVAESKVVRNVEEISANDAVLKYKPDVVVASWVTQYVGPDEPVSTSGCAAGVDEIEMLKHIKRYILFGNVRVHQDKKIFKLPNVKVTEIQSPDFVSRAEFQDLNRLWVVDVLQ